MWWKQLWEFIWYEDSVASWFANLAIAFIIIKYMFYPAVGFVFGTQYPIVAVVSESMEHDQPFDQWWRENKAFYENQGISKEEFRKYPFPNGFDKGDIMILVGDKNVTKGEVVVYYADGRYPIIHRVVEKRTDAGSYSYTTKGDNNPRPLQGPTRGGGMVNELDVSQDSIYGTAVVKIPYLGYAKIWFVQLLQALL